MTSHTNNRFDRRRVLQASGSLVALGLAGCSGDGGAETDEEEPEETDTPSGSIGLELPDGTTECIDPVESDQSIADYYAFDAEGDSSANIPSDLLGNDATVNFVYRNTADDVSSLVTVHGNPDSEAAADGVAPMTFEGVDGTEWLVQDGPPSAVPYETESGTIDGPETALWNWPRDRTDGGALGPLGAEFAVTITHQASGSVRDTTMERAGVDRWLFVDGDDMRRIEVSTFGDDGDDGDISVRISSGCQ